MYIRKIITKFFNSPTFTSYLSYSTKVLSIFVFLPIMLRVFSKEELALWYLLMTIISMQWLADMGFRQTFIRYIAYAVGGLENIESINTDSEKSNTQKSCNWALIQSIYYSMKKIYLVLSIILLISLVIFGTLTVQKSIEKIPNSINLWMSWGIVVIVSVVRFYGAVYSNYLEGLNRIALVRRVETITSIGAMLTMAVVLFYSKSFLWLIVAHQSWILIDVLRNWILASGVEGGRLKGFRKPDKFDWNFFTKIWKPAWRSGLSGIMSFGVTNVVTIIYLKNLEASLIASYLFSVNILNQIRDFSIIPFYTTIPLFSQLRAKQNLKELVRKAQRRMLSSHIIFVLCISIICLCSAFLLKLIHSNIDFINMRVWLLLAFAYMIHRYGAMHIQLYTTTNHVLSHIADTISGVIFIIVTFLTSTKLGLYSLPVGMICGYLGFYAWFAASLSLKSMGIGFFRFEYKSFLIPLIAFLLFSLSFCYIRK